MILMYLEVQRLQGYEQEVGWILDENVRAMFRGIHWTDSLFICWAENPHKSVRKKELTIFTSN